MPTDVKETKAEPKKLKITLIKSTIGAVPKNRAATRGQIRLISHMVKVEELD